MTDYPSKLSNIDTMLKEKPLKLLLKLGVPAVGMALVDELNSFIDAIFMGQYFGSDAVSSMSIILPVMLFVVALAMLFSEGAATAISRYLGAKDIKKAKEYFANTVVITVLSGLLCGGVLYFSIPTVLNAFKVSNEVKHYAEMYMRILSLGLPIFMLVMVLAKMVYTEGKNTFLLVTTLIQLVLNAVINYVLIGLLGFGVMGAALGTLLAQLLQIAMLLGYINSDKMVIKFRFKGLKLSKLYFREVIGLGLPVFLSMILLSVTMGVESKVISGFGSKALSVQTITGYIFSISSSVAGGLMGVSLIILSYSAGAKKLKRFFDTLKISAVTVLVIVTVINLILIINSALAVRLFTDAADVMELIHIPALVYGLTAPFIFTTNVVLYAMQPIGMEKTSTVIFFLQQAAFFMPLLFILRGFGFHYAISAQPMAEVIGGVITVILIPLVIKKTQKYFEIKDDVLE